MFRVDNVELISHHCLVFLVLLLSIHLFAGYGIDLLRKFRFIFSKTLAWVPSLKTVEAVAKRCSIKEVFLEISQNLQENTWPESLFKKDTGRLKLYLKRDSGTAAFLWILQNF